MQPNLFLASLKFAGLSLPQVASWYSMMAQTTKKPTFLAPGRLGLNRGQGMKSTLIPGFSAKATMSKEKHISDIPTSSNSNRQTTSEGRVAREREGYLSHPSLPQSVDEDVHADNTNAARNDVLDQSASQDASRIHEENCQEESTPHTRKRNRRPDAKPRGVNQYTKVANLKEEQICWKWRR